jgi:hypothetical protein
VFDYVLSLQLTIAILNFRPRRSSENLKIKFIPPIRLNCQPPHSDAKVKGLKHCPETLMSDWHGLAKDRHGLMSNRKVLRQTVAVVCQTVIV